jgi:hypothetical protein
MLGSFMKAKCFNVSNWHFHVAGNANHRKSCAQSSTYVCIYTYIYIYLCVCARCLSTRTWRHYHTPVLGRERERERRGKKERWMCIQVQYINIYIYLTIHRHVIVVIMMLYDMQYINKHLTKSIYIYRHQHIPILPVISQSNAQLSSPNALKVLCWIIVQPLYCPVQMPLVESSSQSKNQNKNMKHHETRHVWCLCLEIVPKIRKM